MTKTKKYTREEIESKLIQLAEKEIRRREEQGKQTDISGLAANRIAIYLNGLNLDGTPLSDELRNYFEGDLKSLYDTRQILEQSYYKSNHHLVYNASAKKLFYITIDDFEDPVDRLVLIPEEFEIILEKIKCQNKNN